MCMINKGMFREIVTSSITFANSGVVVGRNVAPAVSGLTVYGDVSASGKIYGAVTVESLTSNVSLSSFSGSLNVSKLSDSGAALNDVLKYQETTPGVSAWAPGKVMVGELTANYELKDGAIVTYSVTDAKFVALDPDTVPVSESSYIKQMGKCSQTRVLNDEVKQGYAAITNDNRVIAWGWLPNDIMINASNLIISPNNNIRIPFWSKYDGYLSASNSALYSPYGGDFLDEAMNEDEKIENPLDKNKYSIVDLYWSRHAGMALVSSAKTYGGDVWVAGKNVLGSVFAGGSNPNSLVKTKHNSYIVANGVAANANVSPVAGGLYLINPDKDICNIQKYAYTANANVDIIPDLAANTDLLSTEDFYYITETAQIRKINQFGESIATYTTSAPNAFVNLRGMVMVTNQPGLATPNDKNLLYVCDGGANQCKVKIFDITTGFNYISGIGTGIIPAGAAAPVNGTTGTGSSIQFKNPKKIAVDPTNPNCLYITDSNSLRRIWRKSDLHYQVRTLSQTDDVVGSDLGTLGYTGGTTRFSNPNGIRVSNDGKTIYVADQNNTRIVKIDITDNTETSFSGTASLYVSNTFKTAALFNRPFSFAKDKNNNIYIADYANHVIRKIPYDPLSKSYGDVTTFAGSTKGTAVGKLSAAQFYHPLGITYSDDTDHSLYVANYYTHVIQKIDLTLSAVSIVAGVPGGYGHKDGAGNTAKFYSPWNITYRSTGTGPTLKKYLYVADWNNVRIRQIDITDGINTVSTVAGNGTNTAVLTSGVAAIAAKISKPQGIYYHAPTDELYFSHLNSVQKINFASGQLLTVVGTGVAGSAPGNATVATFKDVRGITVSGTNMYVADFGNGRIRQVTNFTSDVASDKVVTTLAGTINVAAKNIKDGPASSSRFSNINNVFKNDDHLLVCEDTRIRSISSDGSAFYVKTVNGTAAAGYMNTTTQTKTINFAGLDIDDNNELSFTDITADSIGSINDGVVNEVRRMSAGTLGIGEGSGKSTCGFIKVKAVDTVDSSKEVKFTRIQFLGNTADSVLFAALDTEDSLWVWGNSPDGAFGTGQLNTIGPTKVYAYEKNIKDFQITCATTGVSLISIITKDNKLYTAGDNTYFQLGRGDKVDTVRSYRVFRQCKKSATDLVEDADKLIVSNETGARNNLYISTSRDVYACGSRDTIVLARPAASLTTHSEYFLKVDGIEDVAYLLGVCNGNSSNYVNHTIFARKSNNELWSWGYNAANIGTCMTNDIVSPTIDAPAACFNFETKDNVKNAIYLFCNDNLANNRATVAYIDDMNDLYIGGYSTGTSVPDGALNIPYFRKFNMRNIASPVNLVGKDAVIHRKNGTVYKIDDLGASKLF